MGVIVVVVLLASAVRLSLLLTFFVAVFVAGCSLVTAISSASAARDRRTHSEMVLREQRAITEMNLAAARDKQRADLEVAEINLEIAKINRDVAQKAGEVGQLTTEMD
jgi:hypothetical protein